MKSAQETTIVSESALIARINRKLSRDNETLRKCRFGSRFYNELGRFYITDTHTITAMNIDLISLAAELGVIKAGETHEYRQ